MAASLERSAVLSFKFLETLLSNSFLTSDAMESKMISFTPLDITSSSSLWSLTVMFIHMLLIPSKILGVVKIMFVELKVDFFSEAQIYHWLCNFWDFQSVHWRGAGRRGGTFPWHPMLLNLVPIFSHPQNTYVETGCKSVVRSPHQMLVGTGLLLSGFQQRCLIRWEMDTGFHYDNG